VANASTVLAFLKRRQVAGEDTVRILGAAEAQGQRQLLVAGEAGILKVLLWGSVHGGCGGGGGAVVAVVVVVVRREGNLRRARSSYTRSLRPGSDVMWIRLVL
jgi:hypothetical protein